MMNRSSFIVHVFVISSTLPRSFCTSTKTFRQTTSFNDKRRWSSASKERFMSSNSFSKLGLCAPLVDALERLAITDPTEIQTKTIPQALAGRNVMASAETGSGKTLAFLLPIIQRLERPGSTRALVLAPTRELAIQIEATAKVYGRTAGLRTVAGVGGESLPKQ